MQIKFRFNLSFVTRSTPTGWPQLLGRLRYDNGNTDATSTGSRQLPGSITANDFYTSDVLVVADLSSFLLFWFPIDNVSIGNVYVYIQSNGYVCQYNHDMSEHWFTRISLIHFSKLSERYLKLAKIIIQLRGLPLESKSCESKTIRIFKICLKSLTFCILTKQKHLKQIFIGFEDTLVGPVRH